MPDPTQTPEDVSILVDYPDQYGLVQASRGDNMDQWIEKSKASLDKAMSTIAVMAQRAGQLREQIPDEFTQAEIEFGVKLDFEAGALLTKAGAEGSISVKLVWERKEEAIEK
jgi:hypothetical protein